MTAAPACQAGAVEGSERVLTERLELRRRAEGDLEEVRALLADPGVWEHLPSGRHVLAQQTRVVPARWQQGWDGHGLGGWVARGRRGEDAGLPLGVGGCDVRHDVVEDLGSRSHRRGLAQELITAARAAAAAADPERPVVAHLLEHHGGSRRAAGRAGLEQVWRGPDARTPDPAAVRLVYAGRPVPEDALAVLVRS